jgi:hypothetical protein
MVAMAVQKAPETRTGLHLVGHITAIDAPTPSTTIFSIDLRKPPGCPPEAFFIDLDVDVRMVSARDPPAITRRTSRFEKTTPSCSAALCSFRMMSITPPVCGTGSGRPPTPYPGISHRSITDLHYAGCH